MFEIVKATELQEGDWIQSPKGEDRVEEIRALDRIADIIEVRTRLLSKGFDDPGGSMDSIRLYHYDSLVSRWATNDKAVKVSLIELEYLSEA